MPEAQSPTPSNGNPAGSDLHSVANQIEGLMSDEGDISDGNLSRAHPDYDHDAPHDQQKPARDDKGKFSKKAAPSPDEDEIDQADDQLADGDVEAEDTDESGDTDEQLADSADEETQTDEQDTEDEGEAIQTLAGFAEALEMSVEELLEAVTDTFNAAGEETTVTLAELRAGYQKDADYRRQTQQLAERTKQAEQDYTLKMQQFDDQNRYLAAHLQATESIFQNALNDPQLQNLRQSDPAEWSARREELGNNIAMVRQAREQAMQQYQAFQANSLTELKTRELAAIRQHIPDFEPGKQGEQAQKVMATIGYAPQEIAKFFDHRLVLAALELGNLRTEVETLRTEKLQAKDAVKRVTKTVPKLVKPGKTQPKVVKRSNLSQLKARAKKSGSLQDAAAVIDEMGLVDL